jgi:hypothetical protein
MHSNIEFSVWIGEIDKPSEIRFYQSRKVISLDRPDRIWANMVQ